MRGGIDEKMRRNVINASRRGLKNIIRMRKRGRNVLTWHGTRYSVQIARKYTVYGDDVYYDLIVNDRVNHVAYFVRQLKRRWNIYKIEKRG